MKPEFVDNRNGNTLVAALRGHLDWLGQTYAQPVELAIATGYFNPEGFALIADRLERLPKVRLLLGAEPTPPPVRPVRKPGEPRGERFEAKLVHEAIRLNFDGLVKDRNHLAFDPQTDAALRKLLGSLASGRIVSVAGQESRGGVSREDAVFGFVPLSSEAPPGRNEDKHDILITTDVLAEGVNLQQCRNIINYDLPWNPMRLVQRHGRIDRIGSPHRDVFLLCFFPDRRLDALLDLENRIRRKLAQAAASIGVESEVIPGGATNEVVFTEARQEIEKLRREEADIFVTGGEDPHAHSGEEYRQELRKGLQTRDAAIKSLPWAAGSGIAGGPERGHFFCAKVGDRLFLRFVPEGGGEVVRNTLNCLRTITCAEDSPRHLPPELAEATYDAWAKARKDIFDEWTFSTEPANLQPRIRPFFRSAAKHLQDHPPAGVQQAELDTIVEAVEAPWGVRIERALRETAKELDACCASAAIERASVERLSKVAVEQATVLACLLRRVGRRLPSETDGRSDSCAGRGRLRVPAHRRGAPTRRSLRDGLRLIQAWRRVRGKAGMTRKEFCKRQGVSMEEFIHAQDNVRKHDGLTAAQ